MSSQLPDDTAGSQQPLGSHSGAVGAVGAVDTTRATGAAFSFENVSWSVGDARILEQITSNMGHGQVTALIGPNGSGKSSLLRILAGVQRPDSGTLEVDGRDWLAESSKNRAQKLAYVEQSATADRSVSVLDVVLLGRTPHRSLFAGVGQRDVAISREALELVGLTEFSEREFGTLSGGERQRVLIAKALAQQTDILVVDEPTNHLDIAAQLSTLTLLRGLAASGQTVLTALHDLNLAATYCDHVLVMGHGRIVAGGAPGDVLTEELIRKVYNVDSTIIANPRTGKPLIVFG